MQPSGSGQTTMNNQISELTPGIVLSSAISRQVSPPESETNRAGPRGTSGAKAGPDPRQDNNYGFPLRLGRAGYDFPIFSRENIPVTSFSCEDKVDGG